MWPSLRAFTYARMYAAWKKKHAHTHANNTLVVYRVTAKNRLPFCQFYFVFRTRLPSHPPERKMHKYVWKRISETAMWSNSKIIASPHTTLGGCWDVPSPRNNHPIEFPIRRPEMLTIYARIPKGGIANAPTQTLYIISVGGVCTQIRSGWQEWTRTSVSNPEVGQHP